MQSQLWPQQDGTYYADFMFDDAPRGLEDEFTNSLLVLRLRNGTAFTEYGEPSLEHMHTDQHIRIRRLQSIEERNVCGHVTCEPLGTQGVRFTMKPYGPLKERAVNDLIHNPTGYGLKLRTWSTADDDDELVVKRIDSIDFIKL